jgi:hypothetical protein
MTIERFRDAMRAEPFIPFRVNLADGRSIPVIHPDFVAWNPGGRTVVVIQPDDSCQHIDLLLVTSLEFAAPERGAA